MPVVLTTAVLIVCASSLMVFAPEGRQGISTIIGVVLIVLALGSIGASQFVIKATGWEVSTKGNDTQSETVTAVAVGSDEAVNTRPGYTSAA